VVSLDDAKVATKDAAAHAAARDAATSMAEPKRDKVLKVVVGGQ
jgi:hypothetical protein